MDEYDDLNLDDGGKSYRWQQTAIVHGGYLLEWEVEDDWNTGRQRYTGESRYVPLDPVSDSALLED